MKCPFLSVVKARGCDGPMTCPKQSYEIDDGCPWFAIIKGQEVCTKVLIKCTDILKMMR